MFHLSRPTSAAAAIALAAGLLVATAPTAAAADHTYSPTTGVNCISDEYPGPFGSGYSYRGRCTGTPVGISRGYQYREVITCDYAGAPGVSRGTWRSSGWSLPAHQCPANNRALSHKVEFRFV